MPEPASLSEAFDLSTTLISPREIERIWDAAAAGKISPSVHAIEEALKDSIPPQSIFEVIRNGRAIEKDLIDTGARRIGILFEGKIPKNRRIRVKVGWLDGYVIVTTYLV